MAESEPPTSTTGDRPPAPPPQWPTGWQTKLISMVVSTGPRGAAIAALAFFGPLYTNITQQGSEWPTWAGKAGKSTTTIAIEAHTKAIRAERRSHRKRTKIVTKYVRKSEIRERHRQTIIIHVARAIDAINVKLGEVLEEDIDLMLDELKVQASERAGARRKFERWIRRRSKKLKLKPSDLSVFDNIGFNRAVVVADMESDDDLDDLGSSTDEDDLENDSD